MKFNKELVSKYFLGNKGAGAFYVTDDSLAFHENNKTRAEDHAATLAEGMQAVTRVTREECEKWGFLKVEKSNKDLTVAQLKEKLDELGVKYDEKALKKDLLALLEESESEETKE